jgi:hypothetical protein
MTIPNIPTEYEAQTLTGDSMESGNLPPAVVLCTGPATTHGVNGITSHGGDLNCDGDYSINNKRREINKSLAVPKRPERRIQRKMKRSVSTSTEYD